MENTLRVHYTGNEGSDSKVEVCKLKEFRNTELQKTRDMKAVITF